MSIFSFTNNLKDWEENCRKEILTKFQRYVFGRRPNDIPESRLQAVIGSERKVSGILCRDITLKHNNCRFSFALFYPELKPNVKAACIVYILHPQQKKRLDILDNPLNKEIPIDAVVNKGCAIAVLSAEEIAADRPDGIGSGIFLETKEKRTSESWGVISAWSWGASRVLDFLADISKTDISASGQAYNRGFPQIDLANTAVAGHSRGGKAALWAAATDTRFSACYANCSGCTGAALSRGMGGETVRQINESFPHWFSDNYKNYNDKENELPVDQHQLLALIAPRKLLIASASEDAWADPEGELLSAKLASDVFRLYNKDGLEIIGQPQPNHLYNDGNPAYFLSDGVHSITRESWEAFLTVFTES